MEKLKIYSKLNEFRKNGEINKLKLTALSLSLALLTPMLTSCDANKLGEYDASNRYINYEDYINYDNYNDYEEFKNYTDSGQYESYYQKDYVIDAGMEKILKMNFGVDSGSINSYKSFINDIKVKYPYSQYYNVEKSLELYSLLKKSQKINSNIVIKNNRVKFEDLYDIVLKNNNNYKKQNSYDTYYETVDEEKLKTIVKYITDTINYNISINNQIDLNILDYKLSKLKVFGYNEFSFGFYSQDDITLALNFNSIDSQTAKKISFLQQTVEHETNHIVQDATIKKDSSVEQNFGICYLFKNEDLNALYWNWFVEACAQKRVLDKEKIDMSDSSVYSYNVYMLNALNSTSILIKNNPYELENIMSQNNLNKLFEYFDCESKTDKEEIINMMVANNLVIDPYDMFYSNNFTDKVNIEDEYTFQKQLKSSIGLTQTKIFYKSLSTMLDGRKTDLQNLFSLMSVFETTMSKSVGYASDENIDQMSDFYKNYTNIQENFFGLISKSTGLSIDELKDYYICYYNATDHSKFSNDMLDPSQNQFYKNLYNNISTFKTKTVFEMYNQNKNYKNR